MAAISGTPSWLRRERRVRSRPKPRLKPSALYFLPREGDVFLTASSTITSFIAERTWPYSSGVKNRDILAGISFNV
jgi:hypothetical protein